MSDIILDPLYDYGRISQNFSFSQLHESNNGAQNSTYSSSDLLREWARRTLVHATGLLRSNDPDRCDELGPGFTWLDQMAVYVWALSSLTRMGDMPFVFHYWDLRPYNVILNENNEISYPLLSLRADFQDCRLGTCGVDSAEVVNLDVSGEALSTILSLV